MPNMKQMISSNNKKIVNANRPQEPEQAKCNCRRKSECPLGNNCKVKGIIYQATVTTTDTQKEETYIGLTDNSFKTRYSGHTDSFRNENKRYATALSKHIWKLKKSNKNYSLKWKVIDKGKAYSTSNKKCSLCIKEKFYIICKPHMATLNNRNELASECRHRKKHLLSHPQ